MEEQQIIDIWDTFKDYITEKFRDTAASHYIDFLLSQDIDLSVIESLKGYDPHLDQAIDLVLEDEQEKQEYEDDGYEEEEDEDY